ncbi:MAG: hypothetical protein QOF15_374 [Mycobacterium sp.]|nr:hypothetical protein [Mycobacterium sp.]
MLPITDDASQIAPGWPKREIRVGERLTLACTSVGLSAPVSPHSATKGWF